jgi:hypothetical protein
MNKHSALAGLAAALVASGSLAHDLKVDAGESLAMIVPAKGVQIYECRQAKGQEAGYHGYQWTFVAPEADLFDTRGMKIGRHYAGPQWEGIDGSKVLGAVKARADAPVAGAIPWLLLGTHSVGPEGAFSHVSSIRRVNTAGGLAPGEPCSAAQAGKLARVPYTADYYFFSRD